MNEKSHPMWWYKLDDLEKKLDNVTLWDQYFINDCIHKRKKSGWKPNKEQIETLKGICRRAFIK